MDSSSSSPSTPSHRDFLAKTLLEGAATRVEPYLKNYYIPSLEVKWDSYALIKIISMDTHVPELVSWLSCIVHDKSQNERVEVILPADLVNKAPNADACLSAFLSPDAFLFTETKKERMRKEQLA